jgi:hypothetical protein
VNEPVTTVLSRLGTVRKSGKGWTALCPAHEDKNPSLSIGEGDQGGVRLNCHAGCSREDVLAAIELSPTDVAVTDKRDDGEWTPAGPATAIYDYVDEAGKLLFQVLRCANKQFRQRRPDPSAKSGWTWRLDDVRRVLYRLPRVIQAVSEGRRVFICEGEKDVGAAEGAGEVATCNPGGAGKWRQEYNQHFTGADVVIVADRDSTGQAHARTVAESLRPVASTVTVCEAKAGKDLSDHLVAGWRIDQLEVTHEPNGVQHVDLAPDLHDFLAEVDTWDWCVPGLLERGERLMITGGEGSGKTTWCRQLAITVAAGLHPFTLGTSEPKKVLYVDCENPRTQTRRELRPLAKAAEWAGHPVPRGGLRLIVPGQGLDLTSPEDAAWLIERVTAHRPDVLLIGPLYQLHDSDPNEERPARTVAKAIDQARAVTNCAVVIEAHAGHGSSLQRRDLRPTGTSFWKRWVSYGYGLAPVDDNPRSMWFQPWRGDRDVRQWPDRLDRGNPWPWEGVYLNGIPRIEGAA